MFFCDKCGYLFNITKDVKSKQVGGKINKALNVIFEKFVSGDKISEEDLVNVKGNSILEDERYDSMNKRDQRKVISLIKAIDKNFFAVDEETEKKIGSNVAYFICRFCKNYRKIEPGTLIHSKTFNTNQTDEGEDFSFAHLDPTLARTKNYVCKNPKCATHSDISLREAALSKSASDQIVYICTQCETHWIGGS
jgi:DNA-directed RNA polymerase subunit M/transcription elongation factor TFIIS